MLASVMATATAQTVRTGAAAAGTSLPLGSLAFQPQWGNLDRLKRKRIGLIGPGNIAQRAHLPAYAQLGLNVVAAADVNPAILEQMRRRWGVSALYADYQEMLEKEQLDVVDITVHER
jgi:hypothetical protein